MAEQFRLPLPRLAGVLSECYGVKVEAVLQANPQTDDGAPFQTVTMRGAGAVPACVPPEALRRKNAGYVDEYGTTWIHGTLADGSWYVHLHVSAGYEMVPPGARRGWPLMWCESEVARILKRAARSRAQ